MAYETRVTVYPDVTVQENGAGGFLPNSFRDMMHLEIMLPGLDPAWHHTLVGVQVADDRNSAEVTLHSSPQEVTVLDGGLRVVTWLPAAHIKAYDPDGNELATTKTNAPLQVGQHVEVGSQRHRVAKVNWPHRDPDSGACHGLIDWQHATLTPDPEPAHLPVAAQ